jgi:hypothetical protein
MADSDSIPLTKACKKCGEHKPLTLEFWSPQKFGKFGFTSKCRVCKTVECAMLRARPDQKARQQAWRDSNKDYAKRYNRAYRDAGYSSTADVAAWRAANLEHARKSEARRNRERRAEDPAYRLKGRISARLSSMLQGKAGRRTEELLGYTMRELRDHLERQFTKGMSWAALARGEIEVDHILPVASFNIVSSDDPDFGACWGLGNLRPMWALDNRKKSDKVLTLL